MQTTPSEGHPADPIAVQPKRRDPWLDNIRLVAIVLVVVGHAIGSSRALDSAHVLSNYIYMFHIPLFALAAGWTAQRLTASFATLEKTIWQVLVPYAIFQTIAIVLGRLDGNNTPWQYATASFALWFLLSLFQWRLLAPWFRGTPYGIAAAVGITLMAGFVPEVGGEFSISRTFFFFPAFLVGATYGDRLSEWLDRTIFRVAGAVALVAALAYCATFYETMNRQLQQGGDSYDALGMDGAYAVGARLLTIAVGIVLALSCIALIPRRKTWLTHLGAYTMYAYLLHVVLRRILITYDVFPQASTQLALVALIVAATATALLLMTTPVRTATRLLVEPRSVLDRVKRRGAPSA